MTVDEKGKRRDEPTVEDGDEAGSGGVSEIEIDVSFTTDPGAKGRPGPTFDEAKEIAQAKTRAASAQDGSGDEAGPVSQPGVLFDIKEVPKDQRGPLTGELLEERYLIKEKIGEGGMGVVYRAEQTLMKKEMAVKVLLPEFGSTEGVVRRFHREAQSVSRLDHPGIIHINDFGKTKEGLLFIAMEYAAGDTLTDMIRHEAPLPVVYAIRVVMQLCLALDHAHGLGIVHRDLKPDNVIMAKKGDSDEVVKVLDFGIAKITEGEGSGEALTQAGMVFGTPEYLSPEQAAGQETDHRADLYTLGVIFYELLTGLRPFQAASKLELIGKHISEPPKSLRKAAPDLEIPADLDRIVLKMLAKKPGERYQTASEIFQALSALEIIQATPLPIWPSNTMPLTVQSVTARVPRRRGLLLGGFVGGIMAVVGTVLLLLYGPFDTGESGPAGKSTVDAGVSAKKAPIETVQAMQTLLAQANFKAALAQLEQLADQYPADARIHLLMGQANFLKRSFKDCLRSFREAVRLDPQMKADPVLLGQLYELLTWKRGRAYGFHTRRKAMEFVERYLDKHSAAMMVRFVNRWQYRKEVWHGLAFLIKVGMTQGVDYVHAYGLVLRNEPKCAERKKTLQDLLKRRDPRFLPLLREILKNKGWRSKEYPRPYVSNRCLQEDAARAIKVLEAIRDGMGSGQR